MTTTATSQRFIEIAERLGRSFEGRAAVHDATGQFVADNFADLKEQRLMSAGVPAELGGGGANHAELCEFLRELGQHCGSTALSLSMHTHLLAVAVYRHLHKQPAEALLRKVAASELVLVATGAGDWLDSVGRAVPVAGGYRVSAEKRFCSSSPAGDLLVTSAPLEAAGGDSQVLHFAVPMRSEGVRIRNDWDALGLRGTGSHTVELNEVFVPEESITLRRPRGQWHPSWSVVITIAPPLYMAAYVGIAERAAAVAREHARKRGADALLLQSVGELENQLTIAQLAWRDMIDNANGYDFEPTVERANRALIRKTITTNAVLATVAKAVEVVGGSALFRKNDLERLLRDIQGSAFHPLPEKKQLAFTGRVALGLPPVDEKNTAR